MHSSAKLVQMFDSELYLVGAEHGPLTLLPPWRSLVQSAHRTGGKHTGQLHCIYQVKLIM